MSEGIVARITVTLSLLLVFNIRVSSQDGAFHSVRLLFYNTENFFDAEDDSLKGDDEFLPWSVRRWNSKRYSAKVNSIAKSIIAAGELSPPAIIAMCEIENRKVLEDLIYSPALARYAYGIIHEDSPDSRGIDVCVIYRNDIVSLVGYRYYIPTGIRKVDFTTRSVLCATLRVGHDTINLIVNHWPSRRGGVLAGEEMRKTIAQMVCNVADSVAEYYSNRANIIIMGDFNSTPDDKTPVMLTGDYPSGLRLINLSGLLPSGTGTYRYRGSWEMIDQVIVSVNMLETGKCNPNNSLNVFKPAFLMQKDPEYPGERPFATYLGYRYQGGYSDHLPVMLDIRVH